MHCVQNRWKFSLWQITTPWLAFLKHWMQLADLASRSSLVSKLVQSTTQGHLLAPSHKLFTLKSKQRVKIGYLQYRWIRKRLILYGDFLFPFVWMCTEFCDWNRGESGSEEPVHILAYYSSCGPTRSEELEKFLANIREGRYLRAKNMISKLNKLKFPLKWEQVAKIAGKGVAPGRLHVARAMVEEGYVENLKQAFARYLYDGGPAYSTW